MKSVFTSKTFWVNIIAIGAMVAQGVSGRDLVPLEIQGSILGVINVILRTITKEPVTWQ